MEKHQALEGIRVVDFSWYAVGPQTAKHLADNGAEVIRIESSASYDDLRLVGPFQNGEFGLDNSGYFANQNSNKYGMTLNLKLPKAIEIVKRLISISDVVTESFTPGVIEKFGLSYEEIKKVKQDIIMISMSAQGRGGPYSHHPSYGIVLQALTGLNHLTGWPDGDPVGIHGPYTDYFVPHMAATVLIAALDYRDKTGLGQYIELSQLETAIHALDTAILDFTVNNREQCRMGNFHPYASPHGVYPCKGEDRWCSIAIFTDEEWDCFCNAIGTPDWCTDKKFSSVLNRVENASELNDLIDQWTQQYSPEQAMEKLQEFGVACGVVKNAKDLHEDPQLIHRNHYWIIEHPVMGFSSYDSPAYKLSKTPSLPKMAAPTFGQHTEYICKQILDMSDDELVECFEKGVFD